MIRVPDGEIGEMGGKARKGKIYTLRSRRVKQISILQPLTFNHFCTLFFTLLALFYIMCHYAH